jgi:UDP-glucose 4-epimerase
VRVLLTGVAGFIGSHLLEKLLSNNIDVVGLDNLSTGKIKNINSYIGNPMFKFNNGDVRDIKLVRKLVGGVDAIIHLAALAEIVPSIENPNEYFSTNVTGTFNIIDAAKQCKISRIIYAASSSCYGIPCEYPTSENSPIDTKYPYALTKFLGEAIVLHWSQVYKLSAISLRLFNVYGLRARTSGNYGAVFGVFLAQKRAGVPLTIIGDGNQTRDFTNVKDVVEAMYLALMSDKQGVYNVGTGNPISVNKIAELIGGEKKFIPKRPGEPDSTHANVLKIAKDLNWKSKTSIEEGVKEMIANIDDWEGAPVWDAKSIDKATESWFKYLK